MKLFLKSIAAQKKSIIIFLLAILLPLITVIYLSLDTFFYRQQASRRLLESNLWISSKSAINLIENELLELEESYLHNDDIFNDHFKNNPENKKKSVQSPLEIKYFDPFLLDKNLNVLYPESGMNPKNSSKNKSQEPKFEEEYRLAENYEFRLSDYANAEKQYNKCLKIAREKKNKARVIESIARIKFLQKEFTSSSKYYHQLHNDYSDLLNGAGHPYSLVSLLRLYEIHQITDGEKQLFETTIDDYQKLKKGDWFINTSPFVFFKTELESILESSAEGESKKFVQNIINEPSEYFKNLKFVEYLQNDIIFKIKEVALVRGLNRGNIINRIIVEKGDHQSLISYLEVHKPTSKSNIIKGIAWRMDSLKNHLIPEILRNFKRETELDYSLIPVSNQTGTITDKSNSVSAMFSRFPLPWKLLVVQPALDKLNTEIKKEMIIFGSLLTIIFVFMITGIFLFVRDVKRENDIIKTKTEFIHNVSHELKTPLSLIRLYGETMLYKDNLNSENKYHALKVITKESERLSHMINNILDFSKIEMGRKEFHFKLGDFAHVIKQTLDSYSYHLEKKGFEVNIEVVDDLPPLGFDEEAIEGLVVNILSNAIKYSLNEKVISIKINKDSDYVILEISDKGIGILQDDIPHIFNRFYRSKNQREDNVRGSGLGLTLVKHIVDAHNGKINVQSELGKGTVFKFQFPTNRVN